MQLRNNQSGVQQMRRCNNILYITAFFNLEFGGCLFIKTGHANSLWTLWAQAAREEHASQAGKQRD